MTPEALIVHYADDLDAKYPDDVSPPCATTRPPARSRRRRTRSISKSIAARFEHFFAGDQMNCRLLPFAGVILFCCPCAAAERPVVIVRASYPGASATVLSDTVAAPIEQQVNGVEAMVRIESESAQRWKLCRPCILQAGADPNLAATLVKNRVALARPVLPDVVQKAGVEVKIGTAIMDRQEVQIALIDQRTDRSESDAGARQRGYKAARQQRRYRQTRSIPRSRRQTTVYERRPG